MEKKDSLIGEANAFAAEVFEHIRAMSADVVGVSRQGYSKLESDVHDYLSGIAQSLGMERTVDRAGNTWLRYAGTDPDLPAFVSGSHSDSVLEGGNYDGLAGVVGALTVAWWMHKIGFKPVRDYVMLIIRNEESSFFGKAYIGSLGMTGQLCKEDFALPHRKDPSLTLGDAIRSQGFDPEAMMGGKPIVDLSRIGAFYELHIEQGPTLDMSSDRVGIVTGIRGNYRHKCVRCIGETAHSGAVEKVFRHDAVMALAELAHTMENRWQEWLDRGEDLVFTIGTVHTGASAGIAVVPGEVDFSIDIRSLKTETMDRFHQLLLDEAKAIGDRRGVKFEFDATMICPSSGVDAGLTHKLEVMWHRYGLPCRMMPSGATHDSVVLANKGVKVAMIFVANQKGSHNPHEEMRIDDFILGTELLWRTVQHFEENV